MRAWVAIYKRHSPPSKSYFILRTPQNKKVTKVLGNLPANTHNTRGRFVQSRNLNPYLSAMSSHNTLGNSEWLKSGQSLWSSDGSVELKMQGDGKIAVYWGGQCRYQNTKETSQDVKGLTMQEDGNLVM